MATAVYTTEEVSLQDDSDVVLKPNNIKIQKQFRKLMNKFTTAENEEEGTEYLFQAAALCLKTQRPDFWDNKENGGLGGYTEVFEEAMDEQTMFRVLDVCGGTRFGDPKLTAKMEEAILGTASTSQD